MTGAEEHRPAHPSAQPAISGRRSLLAFSGGLLGAAGLNAHRLAGHLRSAHLRNAVLSCINAGRRGAKSRRLSGERGGHLAAAPL
jgi:hypothetical protein